MDPKDKKDDELEIKKKDLEEGCDDKDMEDYDDDKEDLDESFNQIFGKSLNEETISKTKVLFEAAVSDKVEKIKLQLESKYQDILDEKYAELQENVDTYLQYFTEQYMEENRVAMESGIKVQLAENFLSGMKTLFEDNYVEIPDSKVDLFESLQSENAKLKEEVSKLIKENVEHKTQGISKTKEKILSECSEALSNVQKDKLVSLSEHIEYKDSDQYKSAIETIVERFFSLDKPTLNEEVIVKPEQKKSDMSAYTSFVKQMAR